MKRCFANYRNTARASLIPLALLLGACSGDASNDSTSGKLSLAVTDAPVDSASQVVVEFSGVRVQSADENWTDFNFAAPRQIDLLNLAGGGSEILLDDVELAAGRYQAIRLLVNAEDDGVMDSYITLEAGGEQFELDIPSGSESGLKLNHSFTIAAGGMSAFTVDFDLRKSVVKPAAANQDYKLKPSLRLVDNLEVGRIRGSIAAELLTAAGCSAGANPEDGSSVYLYEGVGATPDDTGGSGLQPLASAPVVVDGLSSTGYSYTLAYVAAGEYTVAFTCQSLDDAVETDENIVFVGPADVALTAGAVAEVNFTATP
jgi:hypothetical protein